MDLPNDCDAAAAAMPRSCTRKGHGRRSQGLVGRMMTVLSDL